jgi:hypothetical protein
LEIRPRFIAHFNKIFYRSGLFSRISVMACGWRIDLPSSAFISQFAVSSAKLLFRRVRKIGKRDY